MAVSQEEVGWREEGEEREQGPVELGWLTESLGVGRPREPGVEGLVGLLRWFQKARDN